MHHVTWTYPFVYKNAEANFYSGAQNSPSSRTLEMLYMLSICPN